MAGQPVPIFTGAVSEAGKLTLDLPADVTRYLRGFANKRVEVTIRPWKAKRSRNQNNYYHGAIVPIIADYCGYTHEEAHEALKHQFLTEHTNGPLARVRSTTSLTTQEFEDYAERVRLWASVNLGLYIPLPNEAEAA